MNVFTPIETLINHYLKSDPVAQAQLQPLEKKTIAIELDNTDTVIYISIVDQQIEFSNNPETQCDVTIKGSPTNLFALLLQKHEGIPAHIRIHGDIHVAQALQHFGTQLHIEWENYIAQWTGPVAAHHIGKAVRTLKNWGENLNSSLSNNAADYLQHEKKLVPSEKELQDFYTAIDELYLATERLEARIRQQKGVL